MTNARLIVLTPTQRAVLGHLAWDGADNPTIALRMGLSEYTIKHHMKGVMAAFGAKTRAAVVTDCLRSRVVVRVRDQRGRHPRTDHLEETA